MHKMEGTSTSFQSSGLFSLGTVPQPPPQHKTAFNYKLNSSSVIAFDRAAADSKSASATLKQEAEDAVSQFTTTASIIGGQQRRSSLGSTRNTMDLPPALAKTGAVLTFRAYFNESVPESPLETWRTRQLVIKYHVDDGSVEASDPLVRNDGLMHGRFLKRMVVPGVDLNSLRIGGNVEMFGRVLRVFAADGVARKYFTEVLGEPELPADEEPVSDEYSKTLEQEHNKVDPAAWHGVKSSSITRYIEAARGNLRSTNKDSKERWQKYDGMLPLRFLLLWETTGEGNSTNTERRLYWLSYYLIDETVEIRESRSIDKNKANFPKLVKRSRLPRTLEHVHDDRARSAEEYNAAADYYSEDDLRVGEQLFVYGRNMLVCDCDDFTQEWYQAEKGVDQRERKVDTSEAPVAKMVLPIPPPLLGPAGIGGFNDEDTLNSWKYLIPKPPRMDPLKLKGGTGKSLRYEAKLVTEDHVSKTREFRITFYLDDSEVSVYEPPMRNSGCLAGIFQKKSKCINAATGVPYKVTDFAPGSRVVVKGHTFTIIAMDEASRLAAERSPLKDISDVMRILGTLKRKLGDSSLSLRKMFRKFDKDSSQTISFPEFLAMLEHYGLPLSKGDAIAVFRAFDSDETGFMKYDTFMKAFSSTGEEADPMCMDNVLSEYSKSTRPKTAEQLQHMIDQAEAAAQAANYRRYQELLVARVARDLNNTKEATRIHETFRRFDVNKDGLISREEFAYIMGVGGLQYSGKDLEALTDKFFAGAEEIQYNTFMGFVADYSQKVIRSS